MTHTCVCNQTIICSDNGLSPARRQAIIWINAGILLIGPFGTYFSEILIICTLSFKKMHLKMSSGKWRAFVSALMCWRILTSWCNGGHIHHGCFIDRWRILWLPQCQWSNAEWYEWHYLSKPNLNTTTHEMRTLCWNDLYPVVVYLAIVQSYY